MKRLFVSIFALALIAAGCGSDDADETAATTTTAAVTTDDAAPDDAAPDDAAEPTGDAIKFGFLNGLSGDYSPWGQPSLVGAEVAIDEINAAGGVLG